MGQYPGLEDFYRHERNENDAYALANMGKHIVISGMIISGIILYYNIIYYITI
jgi:hypothetical protein